MGNQESHVKSPSVVAVARHPPKHAPHEHAPQTWVISRHYKPALAALPGCHGLLVHVGPDGRANVSEPQGPEPAFQPRCGVAVSGGAGPAEVVGELVPLLCTDTGSIVWQLDVKQVFHAADTSRSPCGSNTRLASPSFRLPDSNPSAPESCGLWRLEWALFDHSDTCVSLYLCHTSEHEVMTTAQDAHVTQEGRRQPTALPANPPPADSDIPVAKAAGESSAAEPLVLSWQVTVEGLAADCPDPVECRHGCVSVHDYSLADSNSPQACWGIQGLLSLDDLDALTATDLLRVTLHIKAPEDTATGSDASHSSSHSMGTTVAANAPSSAGSHSSTTQDLSVTTFRPAPPLRIMAACLSPRILVVDNFLEPQLCQELIDVAIPRLVRSRVSTGMETPSRVSQGTFFTGASATLPLIQRVEDRIEELVTHPAVIAGKKKLSKSEALQVVHYHTGGFYHGHFDNRAGGPVTRHVTIIIYLCDCEKGGATYFPRAAAPPTLSSLTLPSDPAQLADLTLDLHEDCHVTRPGLSIEPAVGRAVLFWSALPTGAEDLASLHEAEMVQEGDKWIATRWFKEVDETVVHGS